MQKKSKGGKKNKPSQANPKKQETQAKAKEMMENPQAGLANLQNELMAKISAMKEGLLKGEGGEGLGKEVIDNLFKNLLGDMGMGGPKTIDRIEYEDSEAAHQEFVAEVDDTLTSIYQDYLEIEQVYDKIIRGELEEMHIIPDKETEYTLSAEDEAKYVKENRVYADIKGKKAGLEALEESQNELFESLPEDSVCKKHFNLVKQVNDITRSTFDGNLNYLRMKYLDKKAVPATK